MRQVPKNLTMLVQHWHDWIKGGFINQLRQKNMLDEDTVDDCVQQFYASILESSRRGSDWFSRYIQPPDKGPEAGFKAWLGMCICNATINYCRVRRRVSRGALYIDNTHDREDSVHDAQSLRVEDHEALQQLAQQGCESEVENLMIRLWENLSDEGEMTMLICALFYKGKSPTEIAEILAAKRAKEQGIEYTELDETERIRRLSQCKPIVSQHRSRIQNKAVELDLLSLKSIERLVANHFGVEEVKPDASSEKNARAAKAWQYVVYFCRKFGVATVSRLAERYSVTPEKKPLTERKIRNVVARWSSEPPAELLHLEHQLFGARRKLEASKGSWTQSPFLEDVQDHRLF